MKEGNPDSASLNENNNELFSLSKERKNSLVGIFGLIALSFPFICFLSIISAIIVGFIGKNFSFTPNPITFLVIFLIWATIWLFPGIKEFKINEESLMVKRFLKKPHHIQKDEITHVTWKNNKISLAGNGHTLNLNLNLFSEHERILISHILMFKWIPYALLPSSFQQGLDQLKNNHEQMQLIFENTSTSSSSSRPRILFRVVGISTLLIITILFSWFLLSVNDTTKYMITFLFIAATVPIALLLIQLSKLRQIKADSSGISYQSGKKTRYFDWNNIDAILWSRNQQQIQIWEKGRKRYTPIQYKHMQSAEVDAIFRHVQASVYLLDIPFAMN